LPNKVTAQSFNMYPEDVIPLFPVEDTLWINFQVFGDLLEGDDEGLGVLMVDWQGEWFAGWGLGWEETLVS